MDFVERQKENGKITRNREQDTFIYNHWSWDSSLKVKIDGHGCIKDELEAKIERESNE